MDWFRWYHGTTTDPKLRLIAECAGCSIPDVLAIFAALLERASEAGERGSIAGFDPEVLGVSFGLKPELVVKIIGAMQGRILDGDRFKAWGQRQPKRDRDDPTALQRKQAQRLREKAANSNISDTYDGVTPRHTTSHPVTPRGEEIREEYSPSLSPPLEKPVSKSQRGSRWPDGMKVPEEWVSKMGSAIAARGLPAIDLDLEAIKFAGFWMAKAGRDAVKLDWERTWVNWCLTACGRAPRWKDKP